MGNLLNLYLHLCGAASQARHCKARRRFKSHTLGISAWAWVDGNGLALMGRRSTHVRIEAPFESCNYSQDERRVEEVTGSTMSVR